MTEMCKIRHSRIIVATYTEIWVYHNPHYDLTWITEERVMNYLSSKAYHSLEYVIWGESESIKGHTVGT
jgi:hypothetical protein